MTNRHLLLIILGLLLGHIMFGQETMANENMEVMYQKLTQSEEITEARPFSSFAIAGDVIYLSGQIGTKGDDLVHGGIKAETKQTMDNIKSALKDAGASMKDVFKCTCMLANIEDWKTMSDVYVTYFDKDKLPARSAFATTGLAKGALVEIECMANLN